MSNRVTLAQLDQLSIGELASLPVDQLAMLLEEVGELKARAKRIDDWLTAALAMRYGESAQARRKVEGKDHGKVTIEEDGHAIVCDLPKRVQWDQRKLRHAVESIKSWGDNPDEYVSIELKVAEAKYQAWPSSIRSLFEPARTVMSGRPSFAIKRRES